MANVTVQASTGIQVDVGPGTTPGVVVYDGGNPVQVIAGTPPIVVPPPAIPQLTIEPMDIANLVGLDAWCGANGNYERFQTCTVLTGDSATLGFGVKKTTTGRLQSPVYHLEIYAMPSNALLGSVMGLVVAGATKGSFTFSLNPMPEGWYRLKITPASGPETCPSWFAYRYVDGSTKPAFMPVCYGSYEVMHDLKPHVWAMVPATYAPTPRPLAPRVHEPFMTALPYNLLHREYLVPPRGTNINRPNVDPHGVLCTFNYQAYHWSNLVHKWPSFSLLDGPRGVGTVVMATHLLQENGALYFLDPWRLGEISPDGTVKTLCGYRSKTPPAHFNETRGPVDVELVGDWSAVANKGMHEAWEYTRDDSDPSRVFITDTQNNRVLLFIDDDANPVVTEFLTGLADPWGCVCAGGLLYVSERKASMIMVWNAKTGAFVRSLTSGDPTLVTIDSNRFVIRNAPLATIQAQPCVAPESLAYQDGFIYFGSAAMGQVRKVDIGTGAVTVACTTSLDDHSHFVKIAVSDGTFGPRGTVFTATWSNVNLGMPLAFLPDGSKWTYNSGGQSSVPVGRGGRWETMGYTSAMAVADGCLTVGTSWEGIGVVSKAQPADPVPNEALYAKGRDEFNAGMQLVYGDRGFGYYGFPPPVGQSPELDYFLQVNY